MCNGQRPNDRASGDARAHLTAAGTVNAPDVRVDPCDWGVAVWPSPRSPGQASIRPAEASIRPGFIDVVVTRDYLQRMRVVGIKQLKARLSEYLREVQRGTVFLVTDRDRVVAELRPPRSDRPPVGDELEQVFDALIEAGEVQAARARKAGWTWSPQGLGLESGRGYTVLEWVRADRGEPLP